MSRSRIFHKLFAAPAGESTAAIDSVNLLRVNGIGFQPFAEIFYRFVCISRFASHNCLLYGQQFYHPLRIVCIFSCMFFLMSFSYALNISLVYSKYAIFRQGNKPIPMRDNFYTTPKTPLHADTLHILIKINMQIIFLSFNPPNDCLIFPSQCTIHHSNTQKNQQNSTEHA